MAIRHKVKIDDQGHTIDIILTPESAIHFYCLECVGFEPEEVKKCTAKKCHLYRFRNKKLPKSIICPKTHRIGF